MYAYGSAGGAAPLAHGHHPTPSSRSRPDGLSAASTSPLGSARDRRRSVRAASPAAALPSPVIVVPGKRDSRFLALLAADPPVLARREAGALVLDLRTVEPASTLTWPARSVPSMPVIGTAGHVDHGKSTLVAALTGRDPDRWAEEKARGLTIDLGFAWTTLPDGTDVSFVDVPGHERFMKNMLAGIEAIDVALLVVDAEEGWMPQTEEHVGVLDLLEVEAGSRRPHEGRPGRRGPRRARHVSRSPSDSPATSLEKAPIVGVSARTGEGLDELVSELVGVPSPVLPPAGDGRPRMWVDRSFTVAGAGTVVTGTLLDGTTALRRPGRRLPVGDRGESPGPRKPREDRRQRRSPTAGRRQPRRGRNGRRPPRGDARPPRAVETDQAVPRFPPPPPLRRRATRPRCLSRPHRQRRLARPTPGR